MKRFISIILTICLCASSAACLSSCAGNGVTFYMGIYGNTDEDTELKLNTSAQIVQNKEVIKNSQLVFNENEDKSFDGMYVCFKGRNIKNVTAVSQNKTFLYEHYDVISRPLDFIEFYYKPDPEALEEYGDTDDGSYVMYFDPERDMYARWDGGEFDGIKNVYFNGLSMYDIADREIGAATANLADKEELEWAKKNNMTYYYIDESYTGTDTIVDVCIDLFNNEGKTDPEDINDRITQGEAVTTNDGANEDRFIYKYEKLFYYSQQAALKEKSSFDYWDLTGETAEFTVNYTDGTAEKYTLDVSFNEKGNITAELKLQ